MLTIDQYWLTLLLSLVLPMLVALVTKQVASPKLKSVLLLALSAITGTLTSIAAAGGEFEWKAAVIGTVLSFIVAVGTHFGFLKPVGITGSEGLIQTAVPGGLGKGDVDLAA
jgi:hypothetical protein